MEEKKTFKCAKGALKNNLPVLKESETKNVFLLIGEIFSKEEVLWKKASKREKRPRKSKKEQESMPKIEKR